MIVSATLDNSINLLAYISAGEIVYEPEILSSFVTRTSMPGRISAMGGTYLINTNPMPESNFDKSRIAMWYMDELASFWGADLKIDEVLDAEYMGDDLPENTVY